jgi:hypothetical protein
MFGRWRQRNALNETRRREFLWAVGGDEGLTETLIRGVGEQIEQTYGVHLTERELGTFVKFLGPSLPGKWAKAGADTEGRTPEQFVEEQTAQFVRELEQPLRRLARARRGSDGGPASRGT